MHTKIIRQKCFMISESFPNFSSKLLQVPFHRKQRLMHAIYFQEDQVFNQVIINIVTICKIVRETSLEFSLFYYGTVFSFTFPGLTSQS
jgi:hypothetical protein